MRLGFFMPISYAYSDVYLTPNYSTLDSRSEADTSVKFLDRVYKLPVVPANMESVINEDLCKWMAFNGYFYIMHRFGDTRKFIQRARAEVWPLVSISVGVKPIDYDLIKDIADTKCRVDVITIDIAHGHSVLMKEMISHIKVNLPGTKIIAGNICTPEAIIDLVKWGADAVKVGIAGGHACSTKNMTGFHIPMFTCVKDCAEVINNTKDMSDEVWTKLHNTPIIADGGIRENGDITKALVAGADMVMAGGIFAACKDAPGENIFGTEYDPVDDFATKVITHKRYHGSASAKQKGEKKHVEGFELEIPCNGLNYWEKLQEIKESLQSSISYAGGTDISQLQWVETVFTK